MGKRGMVELRWSSWREFPKWSRAHVTEPGRGGGGGGDQERETRVTSGS